MGHVLSLILQDKGDVKGAEKALRDLIARDPLDANALNSLGYMFAERGERLDEAITLVQRASRSSRATLRISTAWVGPISAGPNRSGRPAADRSGRQLKDSSVVQDHPRPAIQAAPVCRRRRGLGAGAQRGRSINRSRKNRGQDSRGSRPARRGIRPAPCSPQPRHCFLRATDRRAPVRRRHGFS